MTDERFEEMLKSQERCSLCLRGEDADYCSECSDCVPIKFEELKEFWQRIKDCSFSGLELANISTAMEKLKQYEYDEAEARLIRPPEVMNWMDQLTKRADYALENRDLNMAYQVYGEAKMARMLGAITLNQFFELNRKLIREGINNPEARLN